MDQPTLHARLIELGHQTRIQGSVAEFLFDNEPIICISDVPNDRMQFLTPIIKEDELNEALMRVLLSANFHSTLDARYVLGKGVVYAQFCHPLGSLDEDLLRSALTQVANLRKNFGDSFSSGVLVFGG